MATERKQLLLRLDPAVHDALARWARRRRPRGRGRLPLLRPAERHIDDIDAAQTAFDRVGRDSADPRRRASAEAATSSDVSLR